MKISVALCTYNGEKFLKEQINSILQQSIHVDEIVICDDCSIDSTKEILDEFLQDFPNIFKIYINEINLRSNKNFEKAIKLCSGDFIFLSDQDDLWTTDKVEKTLEIFNKNPQAEGVFSDAIIINKKNEILFNDVSLWDSVHFFEKKLSKPIDLHKLLLLKGNFLTGATLCIKKEVKEFCFPFQTLEKSFLHDEWFALILSSRNTLYYSTEKLISYRIHSAQQMGVGDINKNIKSIKAKDVKNIYMIIGLIPPKKFKDHKTLTHTYHYQYEKYKELFQENE